MSYPVELANAELQRHVLARTVADIVMPLMMNANVPKKCLHARCLKFVQKKLVHAKVR